MPKDNTSVKELVCCGKIQCATCLRVMWRHDQHSSRPRQPTCSFLFESTPAHRAARQQTSHCTCSLSLNTPTTTDRAHSPPPESVSSSPSLVPLSWSPPHHPPHPRLQNTMFLASSQKCARPAVSEAEWSRVQILYRVKPLSAGIIYFLLNSSWGNRSFIPEERAGRGRINELHGERRSTVWPESAWVI